MESAKLCYVALLAVFCRCCLSGDCPSDGRLWVTFERSCYHFVHGTEDIAKSYSIEGAKHMCVGYGLLSINNKEENDFVMQYIPQVWKGNMNVWLGMYFDTDNETFAWQDSRPLDFEYWDGDDPDLLDMDTCAILHSSTGRWETVSCTDATENGVVCETLQKSEEIISSKNNPLMSALVILSVITILGISAVIWFLHQKYSPGTALFTSFEYHPPFRHPANDEAVLVEAEEMEDTP